MEEEEVQATATAQVEVARVMAAEEGEEMAATATARAAVARVMAAKEGEEIKVTAEAKAAVERVRVADSKVAMGWHPETEGAPQKQEKLQGRVKCQ